MKPGPDVEKLVTLLRRVVRRLDDDGASALKIARDWQTPLSSPGGRGPKNQVSDPTGNVAARRATTRRRAGAPKEVTEDDLALIYNRTIAHMAELEEHAWQLEFLLELVMRDIPDEQREAMSRSASAGYCQCCNRWVSGTAKDRLRSGFCDACRKAYAAAGKPDRSTFVRERRAKMRANSTIRPLGR